MIVRNFSFAAWAIEQGFSYTALNGNLHLDIDTQTLDSLMKEYRKTTFFTLFNRVKGLNRLVAESSANATLSCPTK